MKYYNRLPILTGVVILTVLICIGILLLLKKKEEEPVDEEEPEEPVDEVNYHRYYAGASLIIPVEDENTVIADRYTITDSRRFTDSNNIGLRSQGVEPISFKTGSELCADGSGYICDDQCVNAGNVAISGTSDNTSDIYHNGDMCYNIASLRSSGSTSDQLIDDRVHNCMTYCESDDTCLGFNMSADKRDCWFKTSTVSVDSVGTTTYQSV